MRTLTATALVLTIGLSFGGTAHAQPQQPAAPTLVALTAARVWQGTGAILENATIVVRGERIVSVAAGGAAPQGATVIDCANALVTPGFVATESPLGIGEISLEPSTMDSAPEGDAADPIRASFAAADGVNPRSSLIPVARLGGVTTAVATPNGGLVAGTSAWIDLAGATPDAMIARTPLALHIDLGNGGAGAAGGARSAAFARLREALDDARLYARSRAAYDRRQMRESRVSRLDLERLGDALARRIPVVVRASSSPDILRAIALGREYGFRLIIAGAEEGWRVARELAAANVTVIVQPLTNLPSTFSALGSRYENPGMLARAGVPVIIRTDDAYLAHNLRQEAGNAVGWGMDRDAALRALTSEPARAFGMDRDYGTIAPGRVANLVVWNGDPFELSSRPTHLLIRGREIPLRSRQTALFERYRDLTRFAPTTTRR